MRIRVSCFSLLFWLFCSCASDSRESQNGSQNQQTEENAAKDSPTQNVVFFGNSLTAGYGLDISEAFPARVQEFIDSLGYDYEVINAGLSGETTASGNSRIDWVLKNKIDVFVLELGANDGLRGIPTTETQKNLQEIIDKVSKKYPKSKIVLAGMQVPPNMGEEYSSDFRSIFPELAERNEIALIPFLLQDVAGEPELNLEDGIHPTPYGHQIVAGTVWRVLRKVL